MNNKGEKFFELFKNIFNKVKNNSRLKKYLFLCLIILIVFIFIFPFNSSKKQSSNKNSQNIVYNNCSALEYCEVIENKIENVLGSVKGVGNVKVFVSINEGPKTVYLTETQNTENSSDGKVNKTQEEIIYTQKVDGDSIPVEMKQILPEIQAVLIVVEGADLKMQNTITNVVASVLSISVSRVEVLEGK